MPAYVIVEIDIHNPKEYEEYRKLTPATLAAHDGRFVVRGGETETLEGEWNPKRIVILEFPTAEKAKKWWSSPEYSTAREIRLRAASTKMIIAQGV